MTHSISWANFYLVCFAVGFCFSFFSFVFGGSRMGRLHLPHFHGHIGGGHLPSAGLPVAHTPVTGGHGPLAGDAQARNRRRIPSAAESLRSTLSR